MEYAIYNKDYGKNKKRVFSFGKVDFYGCGRKINEITLEVTLYADRNGYPEFTVCGDVWNIRHTDIVCGGQCIDDIYNKVRRLHCNTIYKTIMELWEKYHCKDVSNIEGIDKKKMDILFSDMKRSEIIDALKELKA